MNDARRRSALPAFVLAASIPSAAAAGKIPDAWIVARSHHRIEKRFKEFAAVLLPGRAAW